MTFDVVVAHFNEDISWVEQIHIDHPDARIFIYTKSPDVPLPTFGFAKVQRLPNVGRESHTYLHHIIHNYSDLADSILFTQGHPFDHRPREQFFKTYVHGKDDWYPLPNKGKIRPNWKPPVPGILDSGGAIGDWWSKVFDNREKYPMILKVMWFAIFRIKKKYVLSRPISFYERAITTVSHHINPEEGHFFERAWGNLFNGP